MSSVSLTIIKVSSGQKRNGVNLMSNAEIWIRVILAFMAIVAVLYVIIWLFSESRHISELRKAYKESRSLRGRILRYLDDYDRQTQKVGYSAYETKTLIDELRRIARE